MEQDTLRPCPFCGGEAETDRTIERFEYGIGGPNSVMDYGYQAYCKKCSVGQGAVDVPPSSEEEAVKLWNRRADDADRARLVAQVPSENVLNTIKVLAYEMSKTMIGMADRFPEGHVRANVAKLDEVLAWVASHEKETADNE